MRIIINTTANNEAFRVPKKNRFGSSKIPFYFLEIKLNLRATIVSAKALLPLERKASSLAQQLLR